MIENCTDEGNGRVRLTVFGTEVYIKMYENGGKAIISRRLDAFSFNFPNHFKREPLVGAP